MIIITGDIRLKAEHRESGIRICHEHSVRSRKEPGCISHDCSVDIEDTNLVRFIEHWADMDAVQAHFAVPEAQNMVAELSEMKAEPFVIRIFSAETLDEISA